MRVSHSLFIRIFLSFFGYIVTNCTIIGTSLDPRLSVCLCLCLCQYTGILSVIYMHMIKHVQLTQRIIARWIFFFFFCVYMYVSWFIVCAYTSLDRDYFSLSLWISVVVFGYIVTHCRCIFPSLHPCLYLSLSLWIPLSVFGYIVTACTWIDPRFSLSLCLSQCPVYYR